FHDIKPQAPAHILIIPKQHIARISELQNCHISLMGEMLLLAATIARQQGFEQDGYRLVLNCGENAGQEVFHIHLHLLAGRKFAWPPG
ncbi:MAG TPA: HIT domain-containing protein, partial [bacterium]|nr:HIT domain-containing protein [bacterium]